MSPEETQRWMSLADADPLLQGASAIEIRRLYLRMQERMAAQPPIVTTPVVTETAKQRETDLRQNITLHLKRYEGENHIDWGTCNRTLRREGWAARDQLTEAQLAKLWAHVQQRFALKVQPSLNGFGA